jgi:hypothetical protein
LIFGLGENAAVYLIRHTTFARGLREAPWSAAAELPPSSVMSQVEGEF